MEYFGFILIIQRVIFLWSVGFFCYVNAATTQMFCGKKKNKSLGNRTFFGFKGFARRVWTEAEAL